MTVSITIRNLPNETRDALAARAASTGRSLQEYLSMELRELAEKPSITDALAEIRTRARRYPELAPSQIRDALDADRR